LIDWCQERGQNHNIELMEEKEIDAILRQFYAEVRNKDGQEYSRISLISLRYSIERYLNMPPINKGIKISQNPHFASSNKMLDAKLKMKKREGKENTKHKPSIDEEDLKKYKRAQLSYQIIPRACSGMCGSIQHCIGVVEAEKGKEV